MKTRKTPSERLVRLLLDSHFFSQNIVAADDVLNKIDPEFAEFFKAGVCSWLANAGTDVILENILSKAQVVQYQHVAQRKEERLQWTQARSWPSP
eukprot:9451977-Pyramimonas_sp.AAC.1